jgi:hypothetical protein
MKQMLIIVSNENEEAYFSISKAMKAVDIKNSKIVLISEHMYHPENIFCPGYEEYEVSQIWKKIRIKEKLSEKEAMELLQNFLK